MKLTTKLLIVALLLIGAAFAASAQTYWTYGGCSLKAKGYYGTPYGGGPQFYASGGGDQYGYGPAYSLAKQAPTPPNCVDPPPTSRVGTRRSKTVHKKR